jgi:hypothetical protein
MQGLLSETNEIKKKIKLHAFLSYSFYFFVSSSLSLCALCLISHSGKPYSGSCSESTVSFFLGGGGKGVDWGVVVLVQSFKGKRRLHFAFSEASAGILDSPLGKLPGP